MIPHAILAAARSIILIRGVMFGLLARSIVGLLILRNVMVGPGW